MRSSLLLVTVFFLTLHVAGQDRSRKIIGSPTVQAPAEGLETGMGGKVSIEVEVNKAGDVTSVKQVFGPGWVCPGVKRADVTAIRESAKSFATEVKFEPLEKNTSEWIGISFPENLKISSLDAEAEGDGSSAGTGATVTRKRPAPRTIKAGVLNAKAKVLPRPAYPPDARAARASGVVTIEVLIDEEGNIISAKPIEGNPLLLAASRGAACQSEFVPTRLNGNYVMVTGVITYNFVP